MGGIFDGLDDDLEAARTAPMAETKALPESYKAPIFDEPCKKCGGSGRFRGYSGRTLGQCFACKGAGKFTYKTSREDRQRNQARSHDRKAAAQRTSVEAFQAEHPAIWAWMQGNEFPFAVAMVEALTKYGSLTANQLGACQRCIDGLARASAARAERETAAPAVTISKITEAFDSARASGIKRPKLRLDDFTFKPAKAGSRNPGAIYVMQGEDYLGRVDGGRFVRSAICGVEREQAIVAVATDPAAAAKAYGLRTGSCSCCGRTLTDPESIERGIGPICETKFGW